MASKITLTFTAKGIDTKSIDITGTGVIETFAPSRFKSKQVSIAASGVIQEQIKYFEDAFKLDYNREKIYTIVSTATTISIEHFDNTHFAAFVDGTHNLTTGTITTAVTTDTQAVKAAVVITYYDSTGDRCKTANASINFGLNINSLQVYQYNEETGVVDYFINDISFDTSVAIFTFHRSIFNCQYIYQIDGQSPVGGTLEVLEKMVISQVVVETTDLGGFASILTNSFFRSELNQYGLQLQSDGGTPTYVGTNTFSNLPAGLYRAFVKDDWACVRTHDFEIVLAETGNGSQIPDFFFISGKNSVRFADRTVPVTQIAANNYNFLTEEFPELRNETDFTQKYSTSQKFRIQFKSTYSDHQIRIHFCTKDGTNQFENVTFQQKSDNLQRDSYLEGVVTDNADYGTAMVSFVTGNIYGNDAGTVVTGQHVFNKFLPQYYEVGTQIIISGYVGVILAIITVNGIDYAVTTIQSTDVPASASKVIHSIHVALPYEVFHFNIDMNMIRVWFDNFYNETTPEPFANIPDTPYAKHKEKRKFRIEVLYKNKEDLNVWKGKYLSDIVEQISDVELAHQKFHVMEFGSSVSDAEIDYTPYTENSTNSNRTAAVIERIRHLRNIPYHTGLKRVSQAEVESMKLDNEVVKIDYKSMKVYQTNLKPLPAEYGGQLMDLFDNCGFIWMDGVKVVTTDAADISHSGHLSTVGAKLAMMYLSNESDVRSIDEGEDGQAYYPVLT
tara:strand:- start:28988 stop:31174 length:2187 start_codon:yes stop_codon:yes gene_type:complete